MSDKLRLGEILVRAGVLDREVLEDAIQRVGSLTDLGELLVAEGHIDESSLLQTIGKALNLNPVRLGDVQPDRRALDLVGREDCAELFLFPIHVEDSRTGAHLHVAMANPADVRAIKRVTRKARMRIRPLVALAREVREAVVKHYGGEAIVGPMDFVTPSVAPPPATAPEQAPSGAPGMFDFGVVDLSSLDPAPAEGGPLPAAAGPTPGIALSLPIGDGLVDDLDAAAARLLEDDGPAVAYDRARVAAVRRSMPPADLHLGAASVPNAPPPRPAMGPTPSPPRLPLSAPLPPLDGGLPRASATGPLPHARSGVHIPTDPFGPAETPAPSPLPLGLVEAEGPDGSGIQQLLEQFTEPPEPSEHAGNQVIAEALAAYGPEPTMQGEAVFAALDGALLRAGSMSGRLTVVLIRQLARRGLVDADRLIADLKALS